MTMYLTINLFFAIVLAVLGIAGLVECRKRPAGAVWIEGTWRLVQIAAASYLLVITHTVIIEEAVRKVNL